MTPTDTTNPVSKNKIIILAACVIILIALISLIPKFTTGSSTGKLHISVTPKDSLIAISGQVPQAGPDITLSMDAGSYEITSTRNGYQQDQVGATVTKGKTTNITIQLVPVASTSANGSSPARSTEKTAAIQAALNAGAGQSSSQIQFEYNELKSFNDEWAVGSATIPNEESPLVILHRTGNTYQTVFLGTSMYGFDTTSLPPDVVNYLKQEGYL